MRQILSPGHTVSRRKLLCAGLVGTRFPAQAFIAPGRQPIKRRRS